MLFKGIVNVIVPTLIVPNLYNCLSSTENIIFWKCLSVCSQLKPFNFHQLTSLTFSKYPLFCYTVWDDMRVSKWWPNFPVMTLLLYLSGHHFMFWLICLIYLCQRWFPPDIALSVIWSQWGHDPTRRRCYISEHSCVLWARSPNGSSFLFRAQQGVRWGSRQRKPVVQPLIKTIPWFMAVSIK